MKHFREFWLIVGWIIGGIGGAVYHQLTPCIAGCSGGKMSLFIPVFIGAGLGGVVFQILLSLKSPQ